MSQITQTSIDTVTDKHNYHSLILIEPERATESVLDNCSSANDWIYGFDFKPEAADMDHYKAAEESESWRLSIYEDGAGKHHLIHPLRKHGMIQHNLLDLISPAVIIFEAMSEISAHQLDAIEENSNRILITGIDMMIKTPIKDPVEKILIQQSRTPTPAEQLFRGARHKGGRPPIGTKSKNGILEPADNYNKVCRYLQQVCRDEVSVSEAARKLDVTRKTIRNAINDRAHLYRGVEP